MERSPGTSPPSSTSSPTEFREGEDTTVGWAAPAVAADAFEVPSPAVASYLDADHLGTAVQLTGLGSLTDAGPTELAFSTYRSREPVEDTDAGAVICLPAIGNVEDQTQIPVANPRLGFARATNAFFGPTEAGDRPRVHETAWVHETVEIGDGTKIGPHVFVHPGVRIGPRCVVRAGSVIGGAGFGFARDESGTPHRLMHQGGVRIGSDVEIGPNCTIDRGVFDETVIGDETKLSGHVHVAHQVRIGRAAIVAFGAGFGGGAAVGDRVTIHPEATVAEDVRVADDAEIGMNSTVLDDVPSGATVVGSPARPPDATDE